MVSKPTVQIGSATTIGLTHPATPTLPKPVETFRRVPYAKAHRFKRPTLVTPEDTIDASTPKSAIFPNPMMPGKVEIPEDTLTLNITRPAKTLPEDSLPVVMYLHGGAFNFGSPADADSRGWVGRSATDVIVVAVAYRTGALGFGGAENNLGLMDQRISREWVDRYIGYFGGNREDVVMLGVSAGGHSVGHYMLNPLPNVPPLKRAILESASPTARSVLSPQHPRVQAQARRLQSILPDAASAPLDKVLDASIKVFGESTRSLTWPWQPVVADPIPEPPLKLWQQAAHVPDVLTGFCRTEGQTFIQPNHPPFGEFWATLIPNIPLDELERLYPASLFGGDERERLYVAYGDYAYKCPVVHTAHMVRSKGGRAYLYEYAGQDGTRGTSAHCSHGGVVRGNPQKPGLRRVSAEMKQRWEAFAAGQMGAEWPVFETPFGEDGTGDGEILVFGEGNDEAAGGREEGTAVRVRRLSEREKTVCEFWWKYMELSQGMGEKGGC